MYTEDDEKVTVKKNNSNNEYSDFYTSFNEIQKEEKTSKKKKKKSSEKEELKEEKDYSDFYQVHNENENNSTSKNKKIIIIIIIAVLVVIFAVLVFILSKDKTPEIVGDIELTKSDIVLNIGDKEYISYKVVNTNNSIKPTFQSSNTNIATVDNSGQIIAINEGDTVITIYYTIDGINKEKKCNIKVNNDKNVNKDLNLKLNFVSGANDTWTNKDAVISVEASSIFGIASIKYAVNCDSECNYIDVLDNKINISSNGISKIKVLAKDNQNQEKSQEVIVKIDKDEPQVTLNSDKNIVSNSDVTVCATCSDELSGCKENKVCKKYTSSKSNQVITVIDVAGNKKNSESFNVKINKLSEPCSLKVSSDGTVTATLREKASYYGFNSSYTGNNELSKKIDINVSKNGESRAMFVYYYVKNQNGTGGKCVLTVIKSCHCQDKNSTDPNCPVTCDFTSQ